MAIFSVNDVIKEFNLEILYHNKEVDLSQREIKSIGINRGGLELTGFKTKTISRTRRVMLLSSKENEYLDSLKNNYEENFSNLIESHIPVIFLTANFKYDKQLVDFAKKNNSVVPIVKYNSNTADFANTVSLYIVDCLSKTERIHGTLVNIYGYGVLITGESGIGKSETTLDLVKKGHLFIGDDSIDILRRNNKIVGRSNPLVKNLIEIRGIGILNVTKMYGYHIVLNESEVDLVIKLNRLDSKDWDSINRLQENLDYKEYFGTKIPMIRIPVSSGRNLAALIESAVISLKLKLAGHDEVFNFEKAIINKLKEDK